MKIIIEAEGHEAQQILSLLNGGNNQVSADPSQLGLSLAPPTKTTVKSVGEDKVSQDEAPPARQRRARAVAVVQENVPAKAASKSTDAEEDDDLDDALRSRRTRKPAVEEVEVEVGEDAGEAGTDEEDDIFAKPSQVRQHTIEEVIDLARPLAEKYGSKVLGAAMNEKFGFAKFSDVPDAKVNDVYAFMLFFEENNRKVKK